MEQPAGYHTQDVSQEAKEAPPAGYPVFVASLLDRASDVRTGSLHARQSQNDSPCLSLLSYMIDPCRGKRPDVHEPLLDEQQTYARAQSRKVFGKETAVGKRISLHPG